MTKIKAFITNVKIFFMAFLGYQFWRVETSDTETAPLSFWSAVKTEARLNGSHMFIDYTYARTLVK